MVTMETKLKFLNDNQQSPALRITITLPHIRILYNSIGSRRHPLTGIEGETRPLITEHAGREYNDIVQDSF